MALTREQSDILERGTQEVVPDIENVGDLLEPDSTAYVGYEPSGRLHLGHMLTAQKLKDLEDIGMDTTVLLADKHAFLNGKPQNVPDEDAREFISDIADMYETALGAFGLEADIIRGSDFQDTDDYGRIEADLLRVIPQSKNERAIADIASSGSRSAGQVIYPTMQVADIYHNNFDVAVGGVDQRAIHMLARDYQPLGFDEKDKPVAVHTPIIGVNIGDGEKMSSSGSAIEVYAEKDRIKDEINSMYLPPDMSQVMSDFGSDEIDAMHQTGSDDEEIIYQSSPVLQLVNHYALARDEKFEIERPDKYGGDISYESQGELIDDMRSGELHPADIKNGLVNLIYDTFEGPREAVLDEGLNERVEELY